MSNYALVDGRDLKFFLKGLKSARLFHVAETAFYNHDVMIIFGIYLICLKSM